MVAIALKLENGGREVGGGVEDKVRFARRARVNWWSVHTRKVVAQLYVIGLDQYKSLNSRTTRLSCEDAD